MFFSNSFACWINSLLWERTWRISTTSFFIYLRMKLLCVERGEIALGIVQFCLHLFYLPWPFLFQLRIFFCFLQRNAGRGIHLANQTLDFLLKRWEVLLVQNNNILVQQIAHLITSEKIKGGIPEVVQLTWWSSRHYLRMTYIRGSKPKRVWMGRRGWRRCLRNLFFLSFLSKTPHWKSLSQDHLWAA